MMPCYDGLDTKPVSCRMNGKDTYTFSMDDGCQGLAAYSMVDIRSTFEGILLDTVGLTRIQKSHVSPFDK
jgi:hypothetical protein